MEYEIKRAGSTLLTVTPTGVLEERIMGVNLASMSFELPVLIEFKIGDNVEIDGGIYYLTNTTDIDSTKKISSLRYGYSLKFKRVFYDLQKSKYFMYGDDNEMKESDFTLTGNAEFFIDLMIQNIHRRDNTWIKGDIQDTETVTLNFSNESCLRVLSRLAETFKTEFRITGKTIHLNTFGSVLPFTLKYGKGNGLYDIERTNVDETGIITVLYARGSTKNIPANYRGYAKRLQLPVGIPYLENNVVDEDDNPKYGVIEESFIFEEVFPHREGVVTGVLAFNKFIDSGIDFNVNDQLVAGVSAKVVFSSGKLAGYTFDIQKDGYDHAAKSILINQNSDEKAFQVPSADLMPEVGDKYVIVDIEMPESYILAAENELLEKAEAYLMEYSNPRMAYKVTPDPLFFKINNRKIELGSYVPIEDDDFGIDRTIRVVGFTRNLQNLYEYPSLDLSDTVQIDKFVKETTRKENINKAITINKLTDASRARLNWRTGQELLNSIFDPDGHIYTDSISPASIRTLMIEIGAPSQQLEMPGVTFTSNFEQDVNKINWTAGHLIHLTISSSPVTWDITGGTIAALDPGIAYYVYAKCEKNGPNGSIIFSEDEIIFDSDPDYYHFWIGLANSVIDSYRNLKMLYGSVRIYGRTIEGGRILGNLLDIDLDLGTIRGKVQMLDGSYTDGVLVVGENGEGNAFISGITLPLTPDESVRFGAGGEYGDPDLPFKVLDNGTLFTSKLVATAGKIAGFTIDNEGFKNENLYKEGELISGTGNSRIIMTKKFTDAADVQIGNKDVAFGNFAIPGYGESQNTAGFIENGEPDKTVNTALLLSAYGGSVKNVALRIEGGDIVVGSFTGIDITLDVRVGGGDFWQMRWVKGILVSAVNLGS